MGLGPVVRNLLGGSFHLFREQRVAFPGKGSRITADRFVDLLQGIHGFGSFSFISHRKRRSPPDWTAISTGVPCTPWDTWG